MKNLIHALAVGAVLAIGLTSIASAEEKKADEKAAPAAQSYLKVGDTVYVCGCGPSCHCGSISTEPGKCKCGSDLVKAKVAKIDGANIVIDRPADKGETTFKAAYKCGCGAQCQCGTVGLKPGKCKCGSDMVKVN